MEELLRTNDLVLISFMESLLKEAKINFMVTDQHTSLLEGSIGAIQKRIMVESDSIIEARRILKDVDL